MPFAQSIREARLLAAQAARPEAVQRFFEADGRWVRCLTSIVSRRLGVPGQDHEDVFQETCCRLIDPQMARFDPQRGTGEAYVRGIASNAIDFAGRRRQRSRYSKDVDASPLEVLSPETAFEAVEARRTLVSLTREEPESIVRAIAMICDSDCPQREAAAKAGVSEFSLSRALRRLRRAA